MTTLRLTISPCFVRFDRPVVQDISFEVAEAEFSRSSGRAGAARQPCASSRGLERPDGGTIRLGGRSRRLRCTYRRAPRCRHGLSDRVVPHLSVFDNVAFGLASQ